MEDTPQSITDKAIRNTKWVFLSNSIPRLWQPIVTIILARILSPSDFGLMALATLIISFLSMYIDLGLGQALIQQRSNVKESSNVVFISNIVIGIFLFIVVNLASPYAGLFFNEDGVIEILKVLSFIFLIIPLGMTQIFLLSKELDFKELFYLQLIPSVIPGIGSVFFALNGFGVWSLVYGTILGEISKVIVIWLKVKWRPSIKRFKWQIFKELFNFGGIVSAHNMVAWFNINLDNIVAGKFIGVGGLGIYRMGMNVAMLPAQNITRTVDKITYPVFSKIQSHKNEVVDVYLKAIKNVCLLSFPIGIAFIVLAPTFVPVVFGDKWIEAIKVIQILSFAGILTSIGSITPQMCKAIGKPKIFLKFATVRVIVTLIGFFYAAKYGLIALCIAKLVLTMIFVPLSLYIGSKVLNISQKTVLFTISTPFLTSLISGLIIMILNKLLISIFFQDTILLINLCILFITVYVFLIYLLNKKEFFNAKRIILKMIT